MNLICSTQVQQQPNPSQPGKRRAKRLDWKMFGWARNSTTEKSGTMGTMATARVESSDSMPTQAQGTAKPWEPRHEIKVPVLNGPFLKLLASCRSVAPLNWLSSKNVGMLPLTPSVTYVLMIGVSCILSNLRALQNAWTQGLKCCKGLKQNCHFPKSYPSLKTPKDLEFMPYVICLHRSGLVPWFHHAP